MAKTTINKALHLEIEGRQYTWDEQFITGKQLKNLADLGLEENLYLSLPDPWNDEFVENDTTVDLARQGIEYFFVKRALHFTMDGKQYSWGKQFITGSQLRRITGVSDDCEIVLDNDGDFEDMVIDDKERVNLSRPGTEHFKSVRTEVQVTLIVNAKPKPWAKPRISFDEVVILAGYGELLNNPNAVLTVTYDNGPRKNPAGTMVRGDKVRVKNKMIFNATPTDKS